MQGFAEMELLLACADDSKVDGAPVKHGQSHKHHCSCASMLHCAMSWQDRCEAVVRAVQRTSSKAGAPTGAAAALADAASEAAVTLGPTGTEFFAEVALGNAGAALLAAALTLAGLVGRGQMLPLGVG